MFLKMKSTDCQALESLGLPTQFLSNKHLWFNWTKLLSWQNIHSKFSITFYGKTRMNFSTNPILPRPTFYMHFPGGKQYRMRQLRDREGFLFAPGEVKWSRGPGYDSLQNNMKLAFSKLHTGWTPGYRQPEVLNSKALSVSKFTHRKAT